MIYILTYYTQKNQGIGNQIELMCLSFCFHFWKQPVYKNN